MSRIIDTLFEAFVKEAALIPQLPPEKRQEKMTQIYSPSNKARQAAISKYKKSSEVPPLSTAERRKTPLNILKDTNR